MNLLKSIFISNYMMLLVAIAGDAGWMLYQDEHAIAWSDVLVTAVPLLTVITRLMLFKNLARTSARFPLIDILGATGVGLVVWAWYGQGVSVTAPILALAGWGGFLLYAYWFSSYGRRQPSTKLRIGSTLQDFNVKNAYLNVLRRYRVVPDAA